MCWRSSIFTDLSDFHIFYVSCVRRHWFSWMFNEIRWFSLIFMNFYDFHACSSVLKDFRWFCSVLNGFYWFSLFPISFSWVFVDSGDAWEASRRHLEGGGGWWRIWDAFCDAFLRVGGHANGLRILSRALYQRRHSLSQINMFGEPRNRWFYVIVSNLYDFHMFSSTFKDVRLFCVILYDF